MTRALVIFCIVCAILAGGLLVLRRSARTGMPDAEVLRRAKERASKMRTDADD